MPKREFHVFWVAQAGAWAADCGECYQEAKSGRWRRRRVFFRGIPKTDPRTARKGLTEYLETQTFRPAGMNDPTVDELAQAYLAWAAGENEPRTVRTHRERLEVFQSYLPPGAARPYGERRASIIGVAEVERFRRAMETARLDRRGTPLANGYAPQYIERVLASVIAVWHWASRPIADRSPERIFAANALAGLRKPSVARPAGKYLSAEQRAALLRWARRRTCRLKGRTKRFDRLTVGLLWALSITGARPSELCGLRGDLGTQAICETTAPSFCETRGNWHVGSRRRTII